MRHHYVLAAVLISALGLAAPAQAEVDRDGVSSQFSFHSTPFGESTYWDAEDGRALGAVERTPWTQVFRSGFKFYDPQGVLRAQATQPWGWGVVLPNLAELHIVDGAGDTLAHVRGASAGAITPLFHILDAKQMHIADAWVENSGRRIHFTHPDNRYDRFAHLAHQSHGENNASWQLHMVETDVLPEEAWPILGAFFSMKFQLSPEAHK